jgi:YD repeat-containing protein
MKKVSDLYKKQGVDFEFPIVIEDESGKEIYFEDSDGFQYTRRYDQGGRQTYFEDSDGWWYKHEYDADGRLTYLEDSEGDWEQLEYDADGNVIRTTRDD